MKAKLEQFKSRDEWLDARQSGIGGSDAAAVLGVSKYKTPLGLYADKLGLSDRPDTKVLARGRKLEPIIVEDYQEETGRGVRTFGIHLFRGDVPGVVSLDGLIETATGKEGPGILEAKSAAFMSATELAEDTPIDWLCQAQHGMAVLDLKWASIAVFCVVSGELIWKDIERNDVFVEYLRDEESEFWGRVERRDPPIAGAMDAPALKLLYPEDDGGTVELPVETFQWWDEMAEAKAELKRWGEVKSDAENHIKQAIGSATYGILPDGTRLSLKTTKRKGYTVADTTFRTLRKEKK